MWSLVLQHTSIICISVTNINVTDTPRGTILLYWLFNHIFKCIYSDFTDVCSLGSNEHNSSIDSGNGLVPTRRQAII